MSKISLSFRRLYFCRQESVHEVTWHGGFYLLKFARKQTFFFLGSHSIASNLLIILFFNKKYKYLLFSFQLISTLLARRSSPAKKVYNLLNTHFTTNIPHVFKNFVLLIFQILSVFKRGTTY